MFDCELVGKIGSMALIRRDEYDIDYNVFSRVGAELTPGCIWISSGAVEIGRLDYMKRNSGKEIDNTNTEEINACYAAQGQSIVMENYRRFIHPAYSVRQVLVEHQHFNEPEKFNFIRKLLLDSINQNAIPIINYNDSISNTETRKMELFNLRQHQEKVVECIDNDETASEIATLVKSKNVTRGRRYCHAGLRDSISVPLSPPCHSMESILDISNYIQYNILMESKLYMIEVMI